VSQDAHSSGATLAPRWFKAAAAVYEMPGPAKSVLGPGLERNSVAAYGSSAWLREIIRQEVPTAWCWQVRESAACPHPSSYNRGDIILLGSPGAAMADYLFYCKPGQAEADLYEPYHNHYASEQFGKLAVGDVVWSVTSNGGKLFLFGRLIVDYIVDGEEAEAILGHSNLYEASFHVITDSPEPSFPIDISEAALQLRFDGTVDRLPMGFSGRNLQSIRKLAIPSVQQMEETWASTFAAHWQAIKAMEGVEFCWLEFDKVDEDAEWLQTDRNCGVTIRLVHDDPNMTALMLTEICTHLKAIDNFDFLDLSGLSIGAQPTSSLDVLSNLKSLTLRDTDMATSAVEKLQQQLPNCSITLCTVRNEGQSSFYSHWGDYLSNIGETESAIVEYSQAIRLSPNEATAFNNRGVAHVKIADFDKAITDFTKVIALDPSDAQAFFNRGVAHEELGENEQATVDYTKAIELGYEPDD